MAEGDKTTEQHEPTKEELEYWGKIIQEKQAREAGMHLPLNWPHDVNGQPMAIAIGQASELIPTQPFGNIQIGPAAIMRPIPNSSDLNELAADLRLTELVAQYVVGIERRLIQWTMDPSLKIERPSQLEIAGVPFKDWVMKKISPVEPQEQTPAPADPAADPGSSGN